MTKPFSLSILLSFLLYYATAQPASEYHVYKMEFEDLKQSESSDGFYREFFVYGDLAEKIKSDESIGGKPPILMSKVNTVTGVDDKILIEFQEAFVSPDFKSFVQFGTKDYPASKAEFKRKDGFYGYYITVTERGFGNRPAIDNEAEEKAFVDYLIKL